MDEIVVNNTIKNILRNALFGLILISALFPWSPPILNFTDLQPTPIIFSILYFIIFVRKISFVCIWPISAFLAAISLMFFFGIDVNSLRGVYPYLSFTILIIVTVDYLNFSSNTLNLWIIYACTFVWFCVAVIQFQNPEFAHSLISRAAITSLSQGRGVSSLAPEPTFYAIQMLVLSILIFLLYLMRSIRSQDYFLLLAIIFAQILLLSKSALIIVILLTAIFLYSVVFKLRYILVTPLIVGVIAYFKIGRLGVFLNRIDFYELKLSNYTSDESFSDRISQIFYSYYNSITDFFIPHGFNSWQFINADTFKSILGANTISSNPRVLSLTGGILYELGILGVPLIIFILAFPFFSLQRSPVSLRFGITVLIFLLTLNAVPLALPCIAIVYALFITIYYQDKWQKNESNIRK
jgi:hypothetical protein